MGGSVGRCHCAFSRALTCTRPAATSSRHQNPRPMISTETRWRDMSLGAAPEPKVQRLGVGIEAVNLRYFGSCPECRPHKWAIGAPAFCPADRVLPKQPFGQDDSPGSNEATKGALSCVQVEIDPTCSALVIFFFTSQAISP